MRGAPLPLKATNEDGNRVAIRDGTGSKCQLPDNGTVMDKLPAVLPLLLLAVALPPVFHKWVIVMVGDSMRPTIGPVAIGLCDGNLKGIREGDIVAFRYANRTVVHRVVYVGGDVIVTKGDNNDYFEFARKGDIICRITHYISLVPP